MSICNNRCEILQMKYQQDLDLMSLDSGGIKQLLLYHIDMDVLSLPNRETCILRIKASQY